MTVQYYRMLTNEDIDAIHAASIDVLQHTGLHITHPVALEKLSAAGAKVDAAKKQVTLTPEMVATALASAPKQFLCAGRSPEFDFTLRTDIRVAPRFRSAGGPINYYDPLSNTCRPLTLADCKEFARLVDALEHIDTVGCPAPQDPPKATYDLHTLKGLLQSGRKHIWALPASSANLKLQLEMMLAVAGGSENLRQRPLCSGIVCLIEPLHFPDDEIERLLLYGQYNLPVRVPLVPMSGANAPYTLAGMLTHINAEALGSLVLLQTLCPGLPTWYYCLPQDMDMRKGSAIFFSPEIMLVYSGLIQMARHYGIPSAVSPCISADSQMHQVMYERGTALALSALCGVSEVGGAGGVDGGLSLSTHILVIDDEMAAFCGRMDEGFEIDHETLAVEAIGRVGHRGNFLADPHTLNFLRKEKRFLPSLFDWRSYAEWCTDGQTIVERADEKLKNSLSRHEVPPLETALDQELDRIVNSVSDL